MLSDYQIEELNMITILCAGSRGDVQPYLALAIEIKKQGKKVRVATVTTFREMFQSYGIDFYPVGGDYASLNVDPEMVRQAQRADNPLKMFLSFQKMKKYGIHMVDDYYTACQGSDLIVYHPGVTVGYFLAEKFGIPSVLASPFPINRTREWPSVILYGKVKSSPVVNTISYSMLQKMLWMTSESSLKPFWKEKFGRLPEGFGAPFERHTDPYHPAVISCSNLVFPRPADWNEHIHQYGYWFLEEQEEFKPCPELAEFLERGDKPIYVGFGSMFDPADTEKVMQIIVEVLRRTGKRAILNGFGDVNHLPDSIFSVDGIPHSWLFKRVSAVCHHGGAGTTAAGFKAGVPGIIIPFALDQYAWANRAHELGVGSKPVPVKQLTADRFIEALRFIDQDRIVTNAKGLAQRIAVENGVRDCAQVIIECLEMSR
jgi:sterol 3beta-glucosyltransferase